MKFNKERRNEVIDILSCMRNGDIGKEEGENMLASYSPQLVEDVRKTLEEGWKPKIHVENRVNMRKWDKTSVPGRAMIIAVPLAAAYVVSAACVHILCFTADWQPPSYAPFLSHPVLARYIFGAAGIMLGFAAAGISRYATLVSAVWVLAAGLVFELYAAPLVAGALILLVFISQMALRTQNLRSLIAASGVCLTGIGAAFLWSALPGMQCSIPFGSIMNRSEENLRMIMMSGGSLLALIGIITAVIGVVKKK